MKKIIFLQSLLVLVGFYSCTKSPVTEETTTATSAACNTSGTDVLFTLLTRPSGLPTNNYGPDGPGPRRILLATSSDGVNFTRSNQVVSDQANTPNMLVLSSGRILLYYTGYDLDSSAGSSDGANQDAIAVAISDDNAATWSFACVGMSGFGSHPPIGDPDVVQLADGSFRMYVTNGDSNGNISIFSATSTDGFNFVKEGKALNTGSTNYKDSLTQKMGSNYLMYVLNSTNGHMKVANSTDGITFTGGSDSNFQISDGSMLQTFVLSNWFEYSSGQYRIFAFNGATHDIRSFTTINGTSLSADTTVSLGLPLDSTYEKSWVKDAAVQRMQNGTYLMAYVSETP